MAYSTQRAVSDGTLAYIDLAIGYQSRSDIRVFYDDLPANPTSWHWVGTTDKRIEFTTPVPNGVEVLIQRSTRLDRIINVFARGAKFTNATMDINFEQVLYLTQEAVEGSALSDIFNDVDFHGYRIRNLGPAQNDNEGITLGQVKVLNQNAWDAKLLAEAARDKANQWATQTTGAVEGGNFSAKQYAANAAASASGSAASATASQASASASATSATASQTSRLASEAARDRAEAARDRAEGAAAPATEIYTRLTAVEGQSATALSTANSAMTRATQAAPSGAVMQFARSTAPDGWFVCDGTAVSRETYSDLFAAIGTTFGAGDGSTTFNLPDFRGAFIRGWDAGRGLDPGRTFGSYQADLFASHGHGVNDPAHAHGVHDPGHAHSAWTDVQGWHDHANGYNTNNGPYGLQYGSGAYSGNIALGGMDGGRRTDGHGNHGHNVGIGASGTGIGIYTAGTGISIQANGGAETRGKNYALLYCIKA